MVKVCLESSTVNMYPEGTGAQKREQTGNRKISQRINTKIHMVTTSVRFLSASPYQEEKGMIPEGMKIIQFTPQGKETQVFLMDRAYEGDHI